MPIGFIVMQIGNVELDEVCAKAIVPALVACGFEARRIDKHNQGGLLKSEIIQLIQDAEVIVADLTNERPNVYLEIGYCMGINKFRNLILTVRGDHFPTHPEYRPDGRRIHFDLAGYDILAWNPDRIDEFRTELEKRIRRRIMITVPTERTMVPTWDMEWIGERRVVASQGLASIGRTGFTELRSVIHPPKINKTQSELNDAARKAPIHTFGWPIGIYLDRDEVRPKPMSDGIVATIPAPDSYDYWYLRRNGDFYTMMSLFEDERRPGEIFFNTRIVHVTEGILYCLRLYGFLGVDRASRISIAFRHGGLNSRKLTSSSPSRSLDDDERVSQENEVETTIEGTLDEIEASLVANVKAIVAPLFTLFDFFALNHSVYDDIVGKFTKGEVS